MKKFNRNLYPSGGRYFIDADGVKFKGENWDMIALRVANYRKRAGQPPGNPAVEIQAQVCARLPSYCAEDGPAPAPAPSAAPAAREAIGSGHHTERALKWLAQMLSEMRAHGVGRVSRAEAARRAAVCAQCPANRQLNQSCGACSRTRKAAADALVKGSRVNEKLGACKVLGVDNSVAVHLDLGRENGPTVPGHCWRRG